jgi:starch phosphorylase
VFSELDAHRWRLAGRNPVRFLHELTFDRQMSVASRPEIVEQVNWLAGVLDSEPVRRRGSNARFDGTVAYFSAEFGVHASMPGYSGGLGSFPGCWGALWV